MTIIQQIAKDLRLDYSDFLPEFSPVKSEPLDVRLQYFSDDNWTLHYGSAQYDPDHHGYWGDATLEMHGENDFDDIASDLYEQAKDMEAQ